MKDKNVAAILALFLGGIGVHKFYLGRIGAGFLYLIFAWTFIPAMLGLIDFFILALMDNEDFSRRYNGTHQLGPVVVNMLPPGPGYHPHGGYPYGHPPGGPHMQLPHGGYPYGPAGYGPGPGPGPVPPGVARPPGGLNPDELATKLEKLNELRISGLLTEEEFQSQKARLLSQM